MIDWPKYGCGDLVGFFEFCRNLEYGWVDQNGIRHEGANNSDEYALQTPMELMKSRVGICWDQTELQRAWFKVHGYEVETYLLYYELSENCWPSHSILVYHNAGHVCWFEPMFNGKVVDYCGIHDYESIDDLLGKLRTKFVRNGQAIGMLPERPELTKFALYEYGQPVYGINDREFYAHCQRGERIILHA